MMKMDGLILAGGKSTRMGGTHKGSMKFGEDTFTGRIVKELQKETQQIWISYGETMHETYENCQIVRDVYSGCGPLGGLHAGMNVCRGDAIMAVACDMPFMKIEFFRYLKRYMEEEERKQGKSFDGIVPVYRGKINPLAAIYKKKAKVFIEQQLETGNYKILAALDRMDILYIHLDDKEELGEMLQNINTVSDYQALK